MNDDRFSWDINPKDGNQIIIKFDNHVVMYLDSRFIMEACQNRNAMLIHILDCDNTPWMKRWQEEKEKANELSTDEVVKILRGYS